MSLFTGVVDISKPRLAGHREFALKKKLAKCSNPKPIVSSFYVSVLLEHLFMNPNSPAGDGKIANLFYSVCTVQDGF